MSDWTGTGTAATTLTYDDALSTDRDRVRFHLADTTASSGPRPSGGNFTDDEIAGLVTLHGSWQKAVAGGLERLAAEWRKYTNITSGPMREEYAKIAEGYAADAKEWRRQYGSPSRVTSAHVTRIDGYSNDIAADTE